MTISLFVLTTLQLAMAENVGNNDGGVDLNAEHPVLQMEPKRTRAGIPRFSGSALSTDGATEALLSRLLDDHDSPQVKAAVVEALRRSTGEWQVQLSDIYSTQESALVRETIVDVLTQADLEVFTPVIEQAVQDQNPSVRTAAMRAIGDNSQGVVFATWLNAGMLDESEHVRAAAARSAGLVKSSHSWDALTDALSDRNSNVRLRAVRSLAAIDMEKAKSMAQMKSLRLDENTKVSRAATQVIDH